MKTFLLISTVFLFILSCENPKPLRALPYIGNFDIYTYEQNGEVKVDSVYPKIPAFSYLNQDSIIFQSKQLKGKVWVANFFFTSCPSICPPTMAQLKRLNHLTKDLDKYVSYVSFSIDPKTDQPQVLKNYISTMGIKAKNWQFLTGDEARTHDLGVNNFMVHAAKNPEVAGGYAHSDGLVLIDRKGYVRGIYLGQQTHEVNKLEKDIRKLLEIEYGIDTDK